MSAALGLLLGDRRRAVLLAVLELFSDKLKINHLRSSPGPPELAGFYVDSHFDLGEEHGGKTHSMSRLRPQQRKPYGPDEGHLQAYP